MNLARVLQIILIVFACMMILFYYVSESKAEGAENNAVIKVDMQVIAMIESSQNPLAYNMETEASGMWQVTPICLEDYNMYHDYDFNMRDMFAWARCLIVADWYMNERIPRLLKHYGLRDTLDNRLIAYNYGIGNMMKNKHLPLPKETRDYLLRYKKLAGRKGLLPRTNKTFYQQNGGA